MPYPLQPGDQPAGNIDENGDPDGFWRGGVYYGIRKPFTLTWEPYDPNAPKTEKPDADRRE